MFIITRLQILNRNFLSLLIIFALVFSQFGHSQESSKGEIPSNAKDIEKTNNIPDNIYLLINEKSAIKKITRKNNNYTKTSLLRLLEINSELCSYYIDISDQENINEIYNESYEIIEYLRNFNGQTEFYPAGLIRFSYILYKVEEYNEALKYLQTAKSSKFLRESDYVFAVKVNAQVHYELNNYQNVVEQFLLIQDKYFDQIDDELLLVYSRALFKLGNFRKSYATLTSFIKSIERKKKSFSEGLLKGIHRFFIDADQVREGIKFIKRYAPFQLTELAFYALEKNKPITDINLIFRSYTKWEKDSKRYYPILMRYLKKLRMKGAYRHMTYFLKVASSLSRRRRINKEETDNLILFMFQVFGDQYKFNIPAVYSKQIFQIIINTSNGYDGYANYLLGRHYLKENDFQKSYRAFDQAFRLSASQYQFSENKLINVTGLETNRKKIVTKSLDFLYFIFKEKDRSFIPEDDQKDLLENYNKDHPKGKAINDVFLSLFKIYLDQSNFESSILVIIDYLDRFPGNIEVYRSPIKKMIEEFRRVDDPRIIDKFEKFIDSEEFFNRIINSNSKLSTLAKTEFLFNIGLFKKALELVVKIKERDFKTRSEKNRFLLFAARIHLKNTLYKDSANLLIRYIKNATIEELDNYSDIIILSLDEFYNIQDINIPLEMNRLCIEKVVPKMESFEKFLSSYLFSLVINEKEKELISFFNNKKELFNKESVRMFLKISLNFILLDKNFEILKTFLSNFPQLIALSFEEVESIKLKFHEFIVNNKIRKAEEFKQLILHFIEGADLKESYKNRIYNYFRVRDLLYSTFKEGLIQWKRDIENPQEFLDENIKAILSFESQIDEYRGEYAFTDLLITSYFINRYNYLKKIYKKKFNLVYKPIVITQLVDMNNLDNFEPMQILSIKEKSHLNFVSGMTSKVRLFSSDIRLTLDQNITDNFEHYFDYSPIPFIDKLKL